MIHKTEIHKLKLRQKILEDNKGIWHINMWEAYKEALEHDIMVLHAKIELELI